MTSRPADAYSNTVIRVSTDPYFRDRLPWHMGSILLDAGPVVFAHLHGGWSLARASRCD
jgi:hypothetical protein